MFALIFGADEIMGELSKEDEGLLAGRTGVHELQPMEEVCGRVEAGKGERTAGANETT